MQPSARQRSAAESCTFRFGATVPDAVPIEVRLDGWDIQLFKRADETIDDPRGCPDVLLCAVRFCLRPVQTLSIEEATKKKDLFQ